MNTLSPFPSPANRPFVRLVIATLCGLACSMTGTAQAAGNPASLERGRYLVTTILACGNCHTPKAADGRPQPGKELAGGGLSFDFPFYSGTASNITPDRETGIGDWTDDEIKRAITAGQRPNHGRLSGVPLAPMMWVNFYKALLPADLDAVVAYLQSVPPARNAMALPEYKRQVPRDAYPDAERGFTEGDLQDRTRRGAYLATIGHCMECHTPAKEGKTQYDAAPGQGGKAFGPAMVKGYPADWKGAVARNITSNLEAGLGRWTDEEIKRAITQGVGKDGRALQPPMGFYWYAGLTPADQDALVAWLRTVPARP